MTGNTYDGFKNLSVEQLDQEFQAAFRAKDEKRLVAVETERARRKSVETKNEPMREAQQIKWSPEVAAAWKRRAETKPEIEVTPATKPKFSLNIKLAWWEIVLAVVVVCYLIRSKFIAAITGH